MYILNAQNFFRLVHYLESLPDDYGSFNMSFYFYKEVAGPERLKIKRREVQYALHNGGVNSCGAVACAIGHGPAAGLLVSPDEIYEMDYEAQVNWKRYAVRVFGVSDGSSPVGAFMFGSDWNRFDRTARGAAARIRYVLAGNRDFSFNPRLYSAYLKPATAGTVAG
jgi:hypothetical protein